MSILFSDYTGLFEKLIYQNPDNGWSVGLLASPAQAQPLTIVGQLLTVQVGQELRVRGSWQEHAKFGRQFAVAQYEIILPTSLAGMEAYLASGLVKGIGPALAKRLIAHFGESLFSVMDENLTRLREVPGIGERKWEQISQSFTRDRDMRGVLTFFQGYGIPAKLALKIYQTYGTRAVETVQANPYQLTVDVSGVGFQKADQIAKQFGVAADSPFRLRAALLVCLQKALTDGHTFLPEATLLSAALLLLRITDADAVSRELQAILFEERQCRAITGPAGDERAIYLSEIYQCERDIAREMDRLTREVFLHRPAPAEISAFMATYIRNAQIRFSPSQEDALTVALAAKLCIITGGPGTGKTTILKALLTFFREKRLATALAAPTGRAGKRMQESTGAPAQTIHRLLDFDPESGGFHKQHDDPLPFQVVIIDEASMLDIVLMRALLAAIPASAQLILVGDYHQLPSVGAGNVLRDLIESQALPVLALTEIFRQGKESLIAINAHHIQQGNPPLEPEKSDTLGDFYFINSANPDDIITLIRRLVTDRIPKRYGIPPEGIQILSPMNGGPLGVHALNQQLQSWLNADPKHVITDLPFRIGDRVMQTRNNYELEVFNGDIGAVVAYDTDEDDLIVQFDTQIIHYTDTARDDLTLAYAITVHKSQGSEYPAVIFPIVHQHHIMLRRNLVYTALTRAKKLALFIGTESALSHALKTSDAQSRHSGLKYWLKQSD